MEIEQHIAELREERAVLVARITEINAEKKPLTARLTVIDQMLTGLRSDPSQVKQAKKPAPVIVTKEPAISDHAVIRYLERRYGFDFSRIKAELLSPTVRRAIEMGARSVKTNGGRFHIKGNVVATFISTGRDA